MVYLDYEIGSSTRIDTLRSQKLKSLVFNSIGGYTNYFVTFSTFLFSFRYLSKKFESCKYKYLGALYISSKLATYVWELGVYNFGEPEIFEKFNIMSLNNAASIQQLDLETIRERREAQKEKIIENLGK